MDCVNKALLLSLADCKEFPVRGKEKVSSNTKQGMSETESGKVLLGGRTKSFLIC
jgi:hypothetical protein